MKPPNFDGAIARARSLPCMRTCFNANAEDGTDTGPGNRIGRQRCVLPAPPTQAPAPVFIPVRVTARKTCMACLPYTQTPTAHLSEDN